MNRRWCVCELREKSGLPQHFSLFDGFVSGGKFGRRLLCGSGWSESWERKGGRILGKEQPVVDIAGRSTAIPMSFHSQWAPVLARSLACMYMNVTLYRINIYCKMPIHDIAASAALWETSVASDKMYCCWLFISHHFRKDHRLLRFIFLQQRTWRFHSYESIL